MIMMLLQLSNVPLFTLFKTYTLTCVRKFQRAPDSEMVNKLQTLLQLASVF